MSNVYTLKIKKQKKHRPIAEIAKEICANWKKINPSAAPYLVAMHALDQIDEVYGLDTAESIVRYFLANALSFRGEEAKKIKSELNKILTLIDREAQTKNHREAYE